jgi:hypothetical protein
VVGLESDLGMREPKWRHAGYRVRLIAQTVSGLLNRSAVIAKTVGLDN